MEEVFPGIYSKDGSLYTENLVPGEAVYGEDLVQEDGTEYRRWDLHRSKAAAALTKDLEVFPLQRDSDVLYLGASTGTTVSHFSDIATSGMVYAVEYAPQIVRQLLSLSDHRENIAPILGDARKPEEYAPLCSRADAIYQDVAQRDQIRILEKNAELFLEEGGHAMLAIKARSISSGRSPGEVFEEAKERLQQNFKILDGKKLRPFHEDHLFLVLERL